MHLGPRQVAWERVWPSLDQQPAGRLPLAVLGTREPRAGRPSAAPRTCDAGGLRVRGFFGLAIAGFAAGDRRSRVAYAQECSDGEPVRCVPVNAGKLRDHAVRTLKASPSDRPLAEASRSGGRRDELLMHVLGGDFDPHDDVSAKRSPAVRGDGGRRATGEPIPFIKGYAEFRGLELIAGAGVFVPRDSSEVPRRASRAAAASTQGAGGSGPGDGRWHRSRWRWRTRLPKSAVWRHRRLEGRDPARARKNANRLGLQVELPRGRSVRSPPEEAPWQRRCDHAAPAVRGER